MALYESTGIRERGLLSVWGIGGRVPPHPRRVVVYGPDNRLGLEVVNTVGTGTAENESEDTAGI